MSEELEPIRVSVHGYGAIELDCPPNVDEEVAAGLIIEAVSQLMQLVDPATQVKRFHPALGFPRRGGDGDESVNLAGDYGKDSR